MSKGYLKLLVLKELNEAPASGYTIMKKLEKFEGRRPSPGSIYPLLNELLSKKLVKINQEGRKKIYSLTKKGKTSIDRLLTEKEGSILHNMQVCRTIGTILGKKRKAKPRIENIFRGNSTVLKNISILMDVKNNIVHALNSVDTKEEQKKLNEILREANTKIINLVRKNRKSKR